LRHSVVTARSIWLRHGPDTVFGAACKAVAAASWAYAFTIGVAFALHWKSDQLDPIAEWVALPVQSLALMLEVSLLCSRRLLPQSQRPTWWWVLAFTILSPVATVVWNTSPRDAHHHVFAVGDAIYFADYWVLTVAFALEFVRAGGSFRTVRTWLDTTTMTVVPLVAVWAFFLGPSMVSGVTLGITFPSTLAYAVTLACMMAMGALLCLQLHSWRSNGAILLLVAAAVLTAAWEIMWLTSWLTDRDFVGPYYNFGDVLSFAAINSAAAVTQFRAQVPFAAGNPRRRVESFFPALSLLVAIALVAGSVATTRQWDAWVLVALVVLCAMLLITRQWSSRKEVSLLNHQLAQREADARLTELVRRSSDLILLVSVDGQVSFASPASESMVGKPSAQVQHTRASDLFGEEYCGTLATVLERVGAQPGSASTIELRLKRADEKVRVIRMNAANEIANPLINGIVLTFTDITEQRTLEREVLDVATRERLRLSADLHDGLGQELFGISMLLQGAVTSPDPDPAIQASQLKTVVAHLNQAVGTTRDLARGLSPLQVVRGSLGGALRAFAAESDNSVAVRVDVAAAFDERAIDDMTAEHLYRIAQEALTNALHHSGCTHIDIALRRTASDFQLDIVDDGRGFDTSSVYPGLGLRLMEYRAQILGGTLRVEKIDGSGIRVAVVTPIGLCDIRL